MTVIPAEAVRDHLRKKLIMEANNAINWEEALGKIRAGIEKLKTTPNYDNMPLYQNVASSGIQFIDALDAAYRQPSRRHRIALRKAMNTYIKALKAVKKRLAREDSVYKHLGKHPRILTCFGLEEGTFMIRLLSLPSPTISFPFDTAPEELLSLLHTTLKIKPFIWNEENLILYALAEDENPDFSKRNLRANEPTCSMGASVSRPMDRKTEYLKSGVVGDEFGASNAASTNKVDQEVTTKEDNDDV
ncbi:hypothetical protein B7494_g4746 [Chlorociboria aeruginascens]|nr:hypothetical protein B7494_g4746 [Chlorociboria aeruginascens]